MTGGLVMVLGTSLCLWVWDVANVVIMTSCSGDERDPPGLVRPHQGAVHVAGPQW
jgi:hypothetical protein